MTIYFNLFGFIKLCWHFNYNICIRTPTVDKSELVYIVCERVVVTLNDVTQFLTPQPHRHIFGTIVIKSPAYKAVTTFMFDPKMVIYFVAKTQLSLKTLLCRWLSSDLPESHPDQTRTLEWGRNLGHQDRDRYRPRRHRIQKTKMPFPEWNPDSQAASEILSSQLLFGMFTLWLANLSCDTK